MAEETGRAILIERFGELRLGSQKKARMIRRLIPFSSPPTEAIVVTLLAAFDAFRHKDLGEQIMLSKGRISQLLKKLENDRLIKRTISSSDARSHKISLTKRGRIFFERLSKLNNIVAEALISAVPAEMQKSFIENMKQTATGLGAPELKPRSGEFPLVTQLNRIAFITGTISNSYMDTGCQISKIHILIALAKVEKIALLDLAVQVPLDVSSISRIITGMEKDGLVKKLKSAEDSRSIKIALSNKGKREYRRVAALIYNKHEKALQGFSDQELHEVCNCLHQISMADPIALLVGDAKITLSQNEHELKSARSFLVEQLVRKGRHYTLDSQLLPESSVIMVGRGEAAIRAVFEFCQDQECIHLRTWICADDCEAGFFLLESAKRAAILKNVRFIDISSHALPSDLPVPSRQLSDGRLRLDLLDLLCSV